MRKVGRSSSARSEIAGVCSSASRIFATETGRPGPWVLDSWLLVLSCSPDGDSGAADGCGCCAGAGAAVRIAVNSRAIRRIGVRTLQASRQPVLWQRTPGCTTYASRTSAGCGRTQPEVRPGKSDLQPWTTFVLEQMRDGE